MWVSCMTQKAELEHVGGPHNVQIVPNFFRAWTSKLYAQQGPKQ